MQPLADELRERLAIIRETGLWRELRRVDSPPGRCITMAGSRLLNFSSNDYLGLANHPLLKEAATKSIKESGAGAGASRLISGSVAPFHDLEDALAEFKRTEAAITFSTGYAAAVGTITALMRKDDIVIIDRLIHACIVDAAKLSGAKLRVFAHNDLVDLEEKLRWAQAQCANTGGPQRNVLVVTESVFSMDGDVAPLDTIAALKDKYGAWLMVDEAHASGIVGPSGRGLAHQLGVSDKVDVQMGTLGKAIGASGGFICGRRTLIDYLINRARSFIFSTAPVPAAAGAAAAGIRLLQSAEGEQRRAELWKRIRELDSARTPRFPSPSAIIPVSIGDENKAMKLAAELRQQNIFVPAVRFPTVARGSARLRITVTAEHTTEDISQLVAALQLHLHRDQ